MKGKNRKYFQKVKMCKENCIYTPNENIIFICIWCINEIIIFVFKWCAYEMLWKVVTVWKRKHNKFIESFITTGDFNHDNTKYWKNNEGTHQMHISYYLYMVFILMLWMAVRIRKRKNKYCYLFIQSIITKTMITISTQQGKGTVYVHTKCKYHMYLYTLCTWDALKKT